MLAELVRGTFTEHIHIVVLLTAGSTAVTAGSYALCINYNTPAIPSSRFIQGRDLDNRVVIQSNLFNATF